MKNFRPPQVPTISPNLLNQSCDFMLVPPNHVVQDSLGERCLSTEEWSDEKHSMYLKSMEASFVNQLFNSKQGLGRRSPKAALPRSTPTTTQRRDLGNNRCWKKMKYEREKGQISRRNEEHGLKAEAWIHHLSCLSGSYVKESRVTSSKDKECGLGQRNQIPSASPHHHMLLSSDIEMTDQNFDDDEVVECRDKINVKRFKPLISNDASVHQC